MSQGTAGSCRQNRGTRLGLNWANGIVFTYNEVESLQKNVNDKLKHIRMQTKLWSCRGLSLCQARLQLSNHFSFPKCCMCVLPTSEDFIKKFNTIIYNFLWKGPDKIAHLSAINDLKYGGLNLIDIETSMGPLQLAVTWYKIRHAGEQAVHWDIHNKATSSRQICIFFVLVVPVLCLLSSMADFVPCDR